MSYQGPPYQVREEKAFFEDCVAIHPDQAAFDRLFEAIRFQLERAPYFNARPLSGREGDFWLRRMESYVVDDELMPAVYVSFEIVRHPPDGLIALHHVRTEADVRAGVFWTTDLL